MAKPKQTMELNGVANLLLMLDCQVEDYDDGSHGMSEETMKDIREQLNLLERYMVAFNKSVQEGTQNPYWHEIKENPKAYPLNGGRKG